MSSPTLRQTFKNKLLSLQSLLIIFLISALYFSFSVLLLNYRLVLSTVFGNFPLSYKTTLLSELVFGAYSAFSTFDFLATLLASVLVGTNVLIIFKSLKALKKSGGKLTLAVGGSAVLGIAIAGCASCGFSVLSLLGIAGAITFIPFGGIALQFVAIILLIFSFWYSLKTYHKEVICKIK